MLDQKILQFIENYSIYQKALQNNQELVKQFEKEIDDLIEKQLCNHDQFNLVDFIFINRYRTVLPWVSDKTYEQIFEQSTNIRDIFLQDLIESYFNRCEQKQKTDHLLPQLYEKSKNTKTNLTYFFIMLTQHILTQCDGNVDNFMILKDIIENERYPIENSNYLSYLLEINIIDKKNEKYAKKILEIIMDTENKYKNEKNLYKIDFKTLIKLLTSGSQINDDIMEKLLPVVKEPRYIDFMTIKNKKLNEENILLLHKSFPQIYEALSNKQNTYCITIEKNILNQKLFIEENKKIKNRVSKL